MLNTIEISEEVLSDWSILNNLRSDYALLVRAYLAEKINNITKLEPELPNFSPHGEESNLESLRRISKELDSEMPYVAFGAIDLYRFAKTRQAI